MAWLLVDLHRAGVFWGDCSLANTLFRRDGDKIQAFLVDAETSEIHPGLSDGQRRYDLDILVENVAFGLADLGAMQGREDAFDDAVEAAETVRSRYEAVWDELHSSRELSPDDRHAVRARIRRLNDLGFAVDEIELEPAGPDARARPPPRRGRQPTVPRARTVAADGHRRARGPGPAAAQRPARVPRLARASREAVRGRGRGGRRAGCTTCCSRAWRRWSRPSGRAAIRSRRTATSSRRSGSCPSWPARDVGLEAAMEAYLGLGAPAPEDDRGPAGELDRARHRLVDVLDGSDPEVVAGS